jgi:hypothetical protein
MKLHEEFKLVEDLWDDDENVTYYNAENPEWTKTKDVMRKNAKPVYKTFGSHKYDITKFNELEAWVKENAEFQFKRHPNSYKHYVHATEKDEVTAEESHAKYIYITILDNLEKSLDFEAMDSNSEFCVQENINTLRRWYKRDYFDRHHTASLRRDAAERHDKDFEDFINKVFPRASARERDYIKSQLKDIYAEYIKSRPVGVY